MEITSDANGARIERLGAGTTLSLNADAPLEGGDVIISHRDGATISTVDIRSPRLRIGPPAELLNPALPGFIDANGTEAQAQGQTLNIGTQLRTRNVVIGRPPQGDPLTNVTVNSLLRVGDSIGNPGRIDAAPMPAGGPRSLEIGGQGSTTNITIGRAGQDVEIAEDLEVGRDLAVTGDATIGDDLTVADDAAIGGDLSVTGAEVVRGALQVGAAAAAGHIDAGGAAAQNLQIGGGNSTANVVLGRANMTTDIRNQVIINSNRLMLDAAGVYWIVYNANGHAVPPPNRPSIDFAINGVVEFYIDNTGGHNL